MPNLISYYDSPTTSAINQPIKSLTWVSNTGVTINHSNHNVYTLTVDDSGNTGAITHSNVPTGRYGFELHLNWVAGAITFPANWTGDAAPSAVGNYVITGVTIDGGTTWKIAVLAE